MFKSLQEEQFSLESRNIINSIGRFVLYVPDQQRRQVISCWLTGLFFLAQGSTLSA
jgi:hypothetical protein